jgi:DNA-binding NarL/FixJ family response regulator
MRMAELREPHDFTVMVVDAPSSFTQLVQTALFDTAVVVSDRRAALVQARPSTLLVLYEADPLDHHRLAEFAHLTPTVVIAERWRPADVVLSLEAGADGYLDAAIGENALRSALLGVTRGELAYGRGPFGTWFRGRHPRPSDAHLTPRQRQIIDLIATGAPDKEIAAALGVRTSTVQKHVTRLLRRLGVRNRAAAVALHRRSARHATVAR